MAYRESDSIKTIASDPGARAKMRGVTKYRHYICDIETLLVASARPTPHT